METNTAQQVPFAQVLGMSANHVAALIMVGHRLFEQGRIDDAQEIFEGLAVLNSENAYIQGILGCIYQRQKRYELAIVRYNNVLSLCPDDLNSLTNRGEVLLKLGKYEEAASDFKKVIQLDPGKKNRAANRARLIGSLVEDAIRAVQDQQ
jgi:tetratricopeptide (TPR) repeat protein